MMSKDSEEEKDIALINSNHEMEFDRSIKFLKGLYESYKHQRHSEIFKRCAALEIENSRMRKELQKMVKYTLELQTQLKIFRK